LFLLYSTSGCHLCDEALTVLRDLQLVLMEKGVDWLFEVSEITDDACLLERYAVRIPVLHYIGSELDLGWPFDLLSAHDYVLKQLS